MKNLIFLFGMLIALQVNAEIFKCKDANNKISYQNNPCSTTTVGKVRKDADVSEEDRLKAQGRVDAVFERERQKNADEERERLARQERAKEFQLQKEAKANEDKKMKLLERQVIAAEQGVIASKQARIAAERAQIAAEDARRASQTPTQKQRLQCRPDYTGGLICD
ncbi:DUF4124 domain-containing protein [Methylotenera versatilis]|uniref:DUF4124 domain-containing protein n=1 Tax=Methylotenera versatilis TaxID=1055487 RepID=UPI000646AF8D|nr:DUF4124 domain-containing protein [Methylotenera versatilis]